jgi:hypothetical protein
MSFKKVGDAMQTEEIRCSCGGVIDRSTGKCKQCGKEAITKPDIPTHLLKEKEDTSKN